MERLGAAPSLLSGFVALMMVLAPSLSAFVISHVSQPSADMRFGTVPESLSVFDGETESNGRFSGLMETVVVELGDFVHSHSEIFSVEGPCEFLVFSLLPSLGLVSGINTVTPGMAFVTVSHGCWLKFGSCVHSSLPSSLWPSFSLLVVSGVTGTQEEGSLLLSRCPMAGDAGCGAEFEGIEEGYSVRELAVSCPCAAWSDDGFVRDAGTCTSVNGESKGKSSGKDIGYVVLRLWNVLQSLEVVPIGSAACTAFIGSFFAAAACRRAAAFSGVFSVMVIEAAAVLMYQKGLGVGSLLLLSKVGCSRRQQRFTVRSL